MPTKPNHIILQADQANSFQLSMFVPQFDDRIRRVEIDGTMYFSVLDVFTHYGKAANPTTSWNTAQKRLEKQGFSSAREILEHRFPGQGQRATPTATLKTMLRIAQATDFKEWESIRQWMAEVAHERIEEAADPGLGVTRAEQRYVDAQKARGMTDVQASRQLEKRRDGKADFKRLTDAIKEVVGQSPDYGRIVNVEYAALFGMIAEELHTVLGDGEIRDALPSLQYQYICTAEQGVLALLQNLPNLTNEQVIRAMKKIAEPLGAHLADVCDLIGIDRVTGRSLFPAVPRWLDGGA